MLEDLGNLGEFVGGLAVIATLIYLALQIRQNSNLLRRAAAESAASGAAASIGLAAQSPENAAIYHKGLEAISKMPQQDTDASEAHEAEEVYRMPLMARDETAVVLQPGE